jgi:hypothetical protein
MRHLDADSVGLTVGAGDRLPWRDVLEVRVETNDAGPYDEDFFLVVIARGRPPLRIPSTLVHRVLDRIQQLPGFDNDALIKAASSTEKATFMCWTPEA